MRIPSSRVALVTTSADGKLAPHTTKSLGWNEDSVALPGAMFTSITSPSAPPTRTATGGVATWSGRMLSASAWASSEGRPGSQATSSMPSVEFQNSSVDRAPHAPPPEQQQQQEVQHPRRRRRPGRAT